MPLGLHHVKLKRGMGNFPHLRSHTSDHDWYQHRDVGNAYKSCEDQIHLLDSK